MLLTPNFLNTYDAGLSQDIGQRGTWDSYAKRFEYWMVEHIELKYVPSHVEYNVDTSGTSPLPSNVAMEPTALSYVPNVDDYTQYYPALNDNALSVIQ